MEKYTIEVNVDDFEYDQVIFNSVMLANFGSGLLESSTRNA